MAVCRGFVPAPPLAGRICKMLTTARTYPLTHEYTRTTTSPGMSSKRSSPKPSFLQYCERTMQNRLCVSAKSAHTGKMSCLVLHHYGNTSNGRRLTGSPTTWRCCPNVIDSTFPPATPEWQTSFVEVVAEESRILH